MVQVRQDDIVCLSIYQSIIQSINQLCPWDVSFGSEPSVRMAERIDGGTPLLSLVPRQWRLGFSRVRCGDLSNRFARCMLRCADDFCPTQTRPDQCVASAPYVICIQAAAGRLVGVGGCLDVSHLGSRVEIFDPACAE